MVTESQGAFNVLQAAAYCGVKCAAVEEAQFVTVGCSGAIRSKIVILKSDLDAFLAALDIIPAHTPPSVLKRRQERSQEKVTAYVFADRQT